MCVHGSEVHMAARWGNALLKQVHVCAHAPVFVAVSHERVWVVVHVGLL